MFEPILSILRDQKTDIQEFRRAADVLAHLLASKAIDHVATQKIPLQTPFAKTEGAIFAHNITLIPVLRSGIALLPAFIKVFPNATIGFIGLKRDEVTAQAHSYYKNIPPLTETTYVIVLDPTIATGGTAQQTLTTITDMGVPQHQILFVAMLCSQQGIDTVRKKFPHISVISAAIDPELNDKKMIVPGFGDFGDRYFGTE